jgi:hypothetical protein
MTLYLNVSPARRRFKHILGNANHLLITTLIGLDAVAREIITECPEDLHAAWNPINQQSSADRARIMLFELLLVRATDALDTYLSISRRRPSIIQDTHTQQEFDKAGQSVMGKFKATRLNLRSDDVVNAIVEIMILWRNKGVHTLGSENDDTNFEHIIKNNQDRIKNEFRGMDATRLVTDFRSGKAPTFKETASFINATHIFVQNSDEAFLSKLEPEQFIKELIWSKLSKEESGAKPEARSKSAQSIWGRSGDDRNRRVIAFLKNHGLSTEEKANAPSARFPTELIEYIMTLSPTKLLEFVQPTH